MTDTVRVLAAKLRMRSLARLSLKKPSRTDKEDAKLDIEAADALERQAAMLAASPQGEGLTVDALAQEIRRVDGSNTLGAGALAEALMPFLASYRVTEGVKP